jgi:chromosome segregation ATPase
MSGTQERRMSEEHLQRIEALLGTLAGKVDSLASGMSELRGEMSELRGDMATKQDLAGVAKNIDVTVLARQMRELLAIKDDVTVLTAIVQRLDNTMARQISDLLTEVRAEHSRMDRLLSRVRTLENSLPPADG